MGFKKVNVVNAQFWTLGQTETASALDTNIENGLTVEEAERRLREFGRNTIRSTKKTAHLKIFFSQFKSPLILVLIVAGIITLAISHYQDAIFIFVAVAVNTALGFYQEAKADRALANLKSYLKQRARVIREGKEHEIDAEELVPGDIIRLAQGDRSPADSRVIFTNDFQVDESILTGESLPLTKSTDPVSDTAQISDQSSMIFAGTLVSQGVASAIVCRTGQDTEFGKIASLIADSENEKTPLQAAIIRLSLYLSAILATLTAVVFVIGIIAGYSALEMFLTSVAIAVSAIPEGLPISMTVILAVGVERMAKRKGVVRKLVAAEALGSTTVILTDKTGTLTMAKMELSRIIPFGRTDDEIMSYALSNTDVLIENPEDAPVSWRLSGRIMEVSLARAAGLRGMPLSSIVKNDNVLQTIPFNAVQKFSASLVRKEGKLLALFLGAPDVLLNYSDLDSSEKEKMKGQIDELALSGERVLGVASKEVASPEDFSLSKESPLSGLSFDGLLTFRDPIRPSIKHAISRVGRAGIKTVIMTGDHQGTAVAVAKEIGLRTDPRSLLDASELREMPEAELKERLPYLSVISRVTPFDKMRIAKLFQGFGEIVAMTGDGVNDAPSIKQANVGIAMGSGTEVARSVADLVLLDDNFETIVAAIEEGRQILGNIRKVLVYLLSNVTDGLILIGGSLLMGLPLPLNALQILWVNFFADSFPATAFAFEKDPDALSHRPNKGKIDLFDPLMKFLILVIGISTSALLFGLYFTLMRLGYDEELVRTFIFAAFGTYTLLVAVSVRSLDKSLWAYPPFSNPYLTGGIAIGFLLMAAAIYLPIFQKLLGTVSLPLTAVLGVVLVGVTNIVLIEGAKLFYRYRRSRKAGRISVAL